MNTKTRAISEGAMMLALMAVLLIADRQMAGFFELLLYFISVPVVIYEVRHGAKMGMTLCVAGSVIAFMFSTFTGMFYTITALLLGFVYGYGVIKDWKNATLLFVTILANVLITYITVVLFASLFGYNVQEEVKLMMEMMPDISMPGFDMATLVLEIVVLSYLAIAFMQALVTHLLSNLLLQRFKLKAKKLQTIFEVRLPKIMAVLAIVSYFVYAYSAGMQLETWVYETIMAVYLVCMLAMVFDGCITLICYFRLRGKGKLVVFLCMFACMIPGINMLIAGFGIIDILFETRRRWKEGILYEASRKN